MQIKECQLCGAEYKTFTLRIKRFCSRKCSLKYYGSKHKPDYTTYKSDKKKNFVNTVHFDWKEYPEGVII